MSETKLLKGLGTADAAAIVVGSVIGTGIFLKTAVMAQLLGGPGYVMLAWLVAGLLSYAGALTYAELGSRFPRAGGEYAYLREAYGDLIAFLYGWTRVLVAGPGSIAAYAVGSAMFLSGFWPGISISSTAIAFIGLFTALNCLRVRVTGHIQTLLTAMKLLMVFGLVAGIFAMSRTGSMENFTAAESAASWPGWSAFGAALIAALWAYDGWNNLPMVGSEIRNAQKTLPIALGLGMLAIAAAYVATNFAYFYALPFEVVSQASSTLHPDALPVATLAANTFLGAAGIGVMSIIFTVSALGAMHGSLLTLARVPYAMARDRLLPKPLAYVHPRSHIPLVAVLFESSIACVLAMSGTFDQLTDAVVFSSWIFYGLAAASLWKWRRLDRKTGNKPQFLAPGYPLIPLVFVVVSLALLVNTLYLDTLLSMYGLLAIALGVPAFYLSKVWKQRSSPT